MSVWLIREINLTPNLYVLLNPNMTVEEAIYVTWPMKTRNNHLRVKDINSLKAATGIKLGICLSNKGRFVSDNPQALRNAALQPASYSDCTPLRVPALVGRKIKIWYKRNYCEQMDNLEDMTSHCSHAWSISYPALQLLV